MIPPSTHSKDRRRTGVHEHYRCCGVALWRRQETVRSTDGTAAAVLGALEVLPLEAPADTTYGALRARLEKAGRPIGADDLLL